MGISTDAHICFGIAFDEGFSFPWGYEGYDELIDWWRVANGYQSPVELYDEDGEYINGVKPSPEQYRLYFDSRNAFDEVHPLPFELVNAQHIDVPQYILALKSTVITVNRGYPKTFDPSTLIVVEDQIALLIDFCKTHDIEHQSAPAWYLSSYWG